MLKILFFVLLILSAILGLVAMLKWEAIGLFNTYLGFANAVMAMSFLVAYLLYRKRKYDKANLINIVFRFAILIPASIFFYWIFRGLIGLFLPTITAVSWNEFITTIRIYQLLGYALQGSFFAIVFIRLFGLLSLLDRKLKILAVLFSFFITTAMSLNLSHKVDRFRLIELPPQVRMISYSYDPGVSDSNDITSAVFYIDMSFEESIAFYKNNIVYTELHFGEGDTPKDNIPFGEGEHADVFPDLISDRVYLRSDNKPYPQRHSFWMAVEGTESGSKIIYK